MKRFGVWSVFLVVVCVTIAGCGQVKIPGPLPETGPAAVRVLYLVDPRLPSLSDTDIIRALDISRAQIFERTGRTVDFTLTGHADLDEFFGNLERPFGKIRFEPRLDPTRPVSEDHRRILYGRAMDLLRENKMRPIFPLFALDPRDVDMPRVMTTIFEKFKKSLDQARPFLTDTTCVDRRSVFAWYTLLGSVSMDARPAELVLTNDLLIFDSITTLPPYAYLTAGVVAGYTRVYPGISVVSTRPFVSGDTFLDEFTGASKPENLLGILAWTISHEVGWKLLTMSQEEIDHPACLAQMPVPPLVRTLLDNAASRPGRCLRDHTVLPRKSLLADYLAGYARMSILRGEWDEADRAVQRLSERMPEYPAVGPLLDELRRRPAAPGDPTPSPSP